MMTNIIALLSSVDLQNTMLPREIFSQIRAVLFDMDGTLIDSNDAHAQAWEDGFRTQGHTIPWQKVRPLIGMGSDKLIPKLLNIVADSVEGERLKEAQRSIFMEQYLPHLKPFPKARELCEFFTQRDVKIILASSADPAVLKKLIEVTGITDLVETKTSSGDAKHSKPDPDILIAALNKSGLSAAEVIFVGDTPYDVQAAQKLNIPVVAVRCGGWSDTDLEGAAFITDDPATFLCELLKV